jgi:hypothetical protein
MIHLRRLGLATLLIGLCAGVYASVPPMINYQGKLGNASGVPVADGVYSMQFAIYDVSVGGSALWTETNPNVQVKGGLFSVLLGSVNNIPSTVFSASNRFFGVTVGSDPEMTPRQQIASVGFAANSASADTASCAGTATTVPDGAITTSKIANGAVSSIQIADSSINTNHLADQSVTITKLANGSVTATKIENQQAWMPLTLLNGYTNFDPTETTDYKGAYMKDSLGFVHLHGTLQCGTLGAYAFTLPAGYRPSVLYQCFAVPCSGGVTSLTIQSTGVAYFSLNSGSNILVHISVSFKAEE